MLKVRVHMVSSFSAYDRKVVRYKNVKDEKDKQKQERIFYQNHWATTRKVS